MKGNLIGEKMLTVNSSACFLPVESIELYGFTMKRIIEHYAYARYTKQNCINL